MATVTIQVENRSGTKLGDGPIVTAWGVRYTVALDRVGSFEFQMPAMDSRTALLERKKSVVRIFQDDSQVFLGVVESLTRSVGPDGVMVLTVSGRSLLVEMVEALAGIDELENWYNAPYMLRPSAWGFVYKLSGTWQDYSFIASTTAANNLTTAAVYGRMWGETALGALVKIAERINEHFVYLPGVDGDRKLRWVGSNFDDSGVRAIQGAGEAVQAESNDAICFILNMTQLTDSHETVNRVYAYGSGNGEAALTLAAATATVTGYTISTSGGTVVHDARYADWGFYVDKRLQFNDIAPLSNTDADLTSAANYLARAAAAWLERNEATTYELTVMKLPAAVTPGTNLQVVYEDDALTVDTSLLVLAIDTAISDEGQVVHRLTVTDAQEYPPTEWGEVVGDMEQGQVYIAHPQMNANLDTVSYSGVSFDDSKAANLFFVLGPAITRLNQVMLYYRVDPLRSEVETVAGSASVDVDVTLTGHTHAVPNHNHTVLLTSAGTPTYPIGFGAAGTAGGLVFNSGAGGDINYPTDASSGATTSASGGSGTASGTIDLSSAISATYGIFEDSGGTVETTSGAVVKVNGSTVTGSVLSGSWYEVDITSELASSTTGRPTAETNEVTVTASSGKRGRVTAHIEIRSIIQAIAYS